MKQFSIFNFQFSIIKKFKKLLGYLPALPCPKLLHRCRRVRKALQAGWMIVPMLFSKNEQLQHRGSRYCGRLFGYSPPSGAGQVVLMLVMITIVGLTIALSFISRTVTDIRISSQIEQSSRAFSAAQAGVETALKGAAIGGAPGTVSFPDSNSSASYAVTQLGGDAGTLIFPVTVAGNIQTVWLIDHNDDAMTLNDTTGYSYPAGSSFDVCWGTDPNTTPAINLSLYYKTGANYKVIRASFDANAGLRGNGFSPPDISGNCGLNYLFKKTINPQDDYGINPATSKLLFLRLQPVYENAPMALKPNVILPDHLPNQGKIIISTGQTTTGVVRKIQVMQGYSVLPPIIDYGLFVEK